MAHLIDGPAYGAILPTMSTDEATPTPAMATWAWLRRRWVVVAVMVVAIAVPGSIYLNYEMQRRNQLCAAALSARATILARYTPAITWEGLKQFGNGKEIAVQLHDYCGID